MNTEPPGRGTEESFLFPTDSDKLIGRETVTFMSHRHTIACRSSWELGSFGGRLHTQSRTIKGENLVVWYLLAELSELRTQQNKTISEIYSLIDVSKKKT